MFRRETWLTNNHEAAAIISGQQAGARECTYTKTPQASAGRLPIFLPTPTASNISPATGSLRKRLSEHDFWTVVMQTPDWLYARKAADMYLRDCIRKSGLLGRLVWVFLVRYPLSIPYLKLWGWQLLKRWSKTGKLSPFFLMNANTGRPKSPLSYVVSLACTCWRVSDFWTKTTNRKAARAVWHTIMYVR